MPEHHREEDVKNGLRLVWPSWLTDFVIKQGVVAGLLVYMVVFPSSNDSLKAEVKGFRSDAVTENKELKASIDAHALVTVQAIDRRDAFETAVLIRLDAQAQKIDTQTALLRVQCGIAARQAHDDGALKQCLGIQ
jgi:hypothetical protein